MEAASSQTCGQCRFSVKWSLFVIALHTVRPCIKAMVWAHLGSNQGPTGYEPVALPTELWAREECWTLLTAAFGYVKFSESLGDSVHLIDPV